jgi:hypothetical protein
MPSHSGHLAWPLAAIFLSGCGVSAPSRTTATLQQRLAERLAAPIAANEVSLTPQSDGAYVTLLRPPPLNETLDETNGLILADVTEALLDPTLMRIAVSEAADASESERVRAVNRYFEAFNLGPTLRPPVALPPAVPQPVGTSSGVTIRIAVHCPDSAAGSSWDYGEFQPACDR